MIFIMFYKHFLNAAIKHPKNHFLRIMKFVGCHNVSEQMKYGLACIDS